MGPRVSSDVRSPNTRTSHLHRRRARLVNRLVGRLVNKLCSPAQQWGQGVDEGSALELGRVWELCTASSARGGVGLGERPAPAGAIRVQGSFNFTSRTTRAAGKRLWLRKNDSTHPAPVKGGHQLQCVQHLLSLHRAAHSSSVTAVSLLSRRGARIQVFSNLLNASQGGLRLVPSCAAEHARGAWRRCGGMGLWA